MSVHVHIDRVILDGIPLPPHQRPILHAALAKELHDLLATADDLAPELLSSAATASILAAPTVAPWRDAGTLGRQVAGALHRGLLDG